MIFKPNQKSPIKEKISDNHENDFQNMKKKAFYLRRVADKIIVAQFLSRHFM